MVIGSGVTGTSTAWQLARKGAGRVLLLEKDGLATGATGRSSALVRQHYTHETLARMALHSLRVFQHFGDVVGGTSEFRQTGFLVLVPPEDREAIRANVAMHQAIGIEAHALGPEEIGSLEPRLFREDVGGAAWEPESGYADPVATARSFLDAALRAGVERRFRVQVQSIQTAPGRVCLQTSGGEIQAGAVVIAAGFRSQDLLTPLGFDAGLQPVRHAVAMVQRTRDFGAPHPIVSDRINGSYYRPEGTGLTLIGTTAPYEGRIDPEVENDVSPDPEDLATMAGRFCRRFPGQTEASLRRGYTGVYDCSPDLQPLLGPVPNAPGVFLAVGFSGHGFKLSPAVGEMMADAVLTGRSDVADLSLFRPSRFLERCPITSRHSYSVATLG